MNNIDEALLLLVVGMTTVFVILLFIIKMSELLILAVNRFAPVEVVAPKRANRTAQTATHNISPQKIAAITAAINIASQGKAIILKIEK